MAIIVTGVATAHAFALRATTRWDADRKRNREFYARRIGHEPPKQPRVAQETDADLAAATRPWPGARL